MRDKIIEAGMTLWRSGGESAVSARKIASMIGCTHAGALYHFRTAEKMRETIAKHAVAEGDAVIIRQLIVANHPAVASMDQATRQRWLVGA